MYYVEHREQILTNARERHNRNKSFYYRSLVSIRKRIWNTEESLDTHKRYVKKYEKRLQVLIRTKEELELKYGQERAANKKLNGSNIQIR